MSLLKKLFKPKSERDYGKIRPTVEEVNRWAEEFDGWDRDQQLAFLINAYNAFTVELILTEYPEIEKTEELGKADSRTASSQFHESALSRGLQR